MDNLEYEKIIECFEKSSLDVLEITYKDFKIKCKKNIAKVYNSAPQPVEKQVIQESEIKKVPPVKEDENFKIIKSPIVGTFYRAPSPDAKPFVEEGETIEKGQTVCIIEAMKMMNELEADCNCKIVEILANTGDLVEFDQPLFKVEVL